MYDEDRPERGKMERENNTSVGIVVSGGGGGGRGSGDAGGAGKNDVRRIGFPLGKSHRPPPPLKP